MIKLPKKFFKHKTDTVGGKSSMTEHWQRWPTGALSLWSPVLGSQLCCPLKGQHPASSWRPWGWIRTLLGIPIHPSWAFPYTPALFWPRHICTDYVAVLHRRNNLSPRYPRAAQYPAWSRTSVIFFFNWWKNVSYTLSAKHILIITMINTQNMPQEHKERSSRWLWRLPKSSQKREDLNHTFKFKLNLTKSLKKYPGKQAYDRRERK